MVAAATIVTPLSSTTIRVVAYVFFRWIPGHQFVPTIYTAALIYLTSLIYSWRATEKEYGADTRGERKFNADEKKANGHSEGDGRLGTTKGRPKRAKSEGRHHNNDRGTIRTLGTIFLGLPDPKRLYLTAATVAINILLVLGVLDVVYRAPTFYPSHDLSFARAGYVSDTSAKLLLREPDPSQLPLFVSYRAAPGSGLDDSWKSAAQIHSLSNKTDCTHSLTISPLHPSTQYQYALSNNHTGLLTTAPPIGQTHPSTSKFTFLTSSCIKPRFPYNPFSHPLSIPGLTHLSNLLPTLHASFMLFLGDFIYIDVPHRHGTTPETYRREYRQVYSSPSWPPATANLPWLHVIDDHEIANDWDRGLQAPYPSAIDPWDLYHGSINPPPAYPNASYFAFTQGPASFFMLDTRRYRSPSSSPNTNANKTMLGPTQLSSLLTFLQRPEPTSVKWKFIISSIPFTRNWRLNALDTWGGYLHERRTILEAAWDVGASGSGVGVVILSGDRHEFAATQFSPPQNSRWPPSAAVMEFSTSPLSMFYLPVRSYWERAGEGEEEDVCIKYVPDGNSKFGAVEIENLEGGEQSLLRFRLFVDGKERWQHVLSTPPVGGGRGGRGRDAIWS